MPCAGVTAKFLRHATYSRAGTNVYRIFHPHAVEKQASAFSNGTRFVYYTRAETAFRILKNKQIWMRNAMCMNDFMEVQYGLQRLYNVYRTSEAGDRFKSILNNLFEGFRAEIENFFDSFTWHLRTHTYITCVSEHKTEEDTLGRLSMWRAYGGTNGIALVMNNAPFEASEPSDVLKITGSLVALLRRQKVCEEIRRDR